MRQINLSLIIIVSLLTFACGGKKDGLKAKKAELKKLKKEANEIKSKISTLQKEITKLGGDKGKKAKAILVSTTTLAEETFQHIIETRGSITSNKNVLISTEVGGRVTSVSVSEGQYVAKGQTLLRVDATILSNNVKELQANLSLAKTIFEKQERLWKQNIGTEVQYLQAKTTKEALEAKLGTLNSQLYKTVVRAPFSGRVEKVYAKLGEMAAPGTPLVQVLGQSNMKIESDVSEAFLGKFKRGEKVQVDIPSIDKKISAKISAVSGVINPQNRTFKLEAIIPNSLNKDVKPNQLAILSLVDYTNRNAIAVPTSVILTDEKGKFVYVAVKEKGKMIAKKQPVKTGKFYNNQTEVVAGLSAGTQLISSGYRDVIEGSEIAIANK